MVYMGILWVSFRFYGYLMQIGTIENSKRNAFVFSLYSLSSALPDRYFLLCCNRSRKSRSRIVVRVVRESKEL